MAENLDDGELYLPSDIFPDETFYHRRPVSEPTGLTHMEELAQQLAALAMLDSPAPAVRPPPGNFELTKSVRVGALYPPAQTGLGFQALQNVGNGHGHACLGGSHFPPVVGPRYHYHYFHPGKLVQAPAHIIQRERARVLQRQPNPMQNRVMPVRVGGSGTREYGGTGVFLPRVINAESRRKPSSGMKNTEPRKQTMKNDGPGRQGKPYPFSSETVKIPSHGFNNQPIEGQEGVISRVRNDLLGTDEQLQKRNTGSGTMEKAAKVQKSGRTM